MLLVFMSVVLRDGKEEPKRRFKMSREQPAPRTSDGWRGLMRPDGEDDDVVALVMVVVAEDEVLFVVVVVLGFQRPEK